MKKEYDFPRIQIIKINEKDIITESKDLGGNQAGDTGSNFGDL